ncbi:hypothetical protein GGR51DRAFT_552549 [Nemania sp. FL0031]|nr:hypothetical protein GGR51DRAFT_552549 [Nemania sp. FL0031]
MPTSSGLLTTVLKNQNVNPLEGIRTEFIPFKVTRLGSVYDFSGFANYPARHGWILHRNDRCCHGGYCLSRRCLVDGERSSPYGLQSPGLSRAIGFEATWCAEKVAFLQLWLFFGALAEAHIITCGLAIGPKDYFTNTFDIGQLNGLPLRLFCTSQSSGYGRSEIVRRKLYTITRLGQLIMTRKQCEVLSSIRILLRILSLADDFNISIPNPVKDWKSQGQISIMKFASTRLLESGWCRSEVHHFLQNFDIVAAAYHVVRPYAPKHHGNCIDTTCIAYQVDDSSYKTLHIEDNCSSKALARNVVPAINISEDLQLSVVDGSRVKYIAFSHVCKQPVSNALPSCQIRRLYNLACALRSVFNLDERSPNVAIWIDTLCIPVAPELKQEPCRFESRKAPALELGIRILCSGWLKRLWTLQEASLANDIQGASVLYSQMADSPAYWNRLSRYLQYEPSYHEPYPPRPSAAAVSIIETTADILYEMHLMAAMEGRIPSVREIANPRFDTRFQRVMHAVQNRCTSKAEDEPVYLASLLGLKLQLILNVKDVEDRMIEFYKLLHELPVAILFSEFGAPDFLTKNLTTPPYRWAPRSFLALQEPTPIIHQSLFLDITDGKFYSLSLALSDSSLKSIGLMRRCALIFKTDIYSDVVIVSIESETGVKNGACLYVRIVGHVQVKSLPSGELLGDRQGTAAGYLHGASTGREQRWCIT